MDIVLNNILPKMDDQYNPILDGYYINNILPNMDEQCNPIMDGYYPK